MEKMDGMSMNLVKASVEKIKELFPNATVDGKIDFDILRTILGDEVDSSKEKYQFTWSGKSDSIKLAQSPSSATLRPCREKSKNWDKTENLYIEGDNLEVLKQLQKTFYGKIKMMYIDPPYNTGNDFVYKDDFKDTIENYKEQTQQSQQSNAETSGRFHSNWLNMMYPRLILAKNLLSDDGVIFISIDDNEFGNLKKICDEIFNQENLITIFAIENNPKGRKNNAFVAESYEHCLCYARSKGYIRELLAQKSQKKYFNGMDTGEDKRMIHVDEFGEFRQSKRQVSGTNKSNALAADSKETRRFTIYHNEQLNDMQLLDEYSEQSDEWILSKEGEDLLSKGYIRYVCNNSTTGRPSIPLYGKETMQQLFREHSLFFKDDGTIYEKDRDTTQQINSFIGNKKYGLDLMTESATSKMETLFGVKDIFTNSKAVDFIKTLIHLVPEEEYILDFFSGSATTAHAVMQKNMEDGGRRKFIMIQIPELTDINDAAYKAGYKNICEIGEERIRRAAAELDDSDLLSKDIDTGFKVFTLDSTNINAWDNKNEYDEVSLFNTSTVFKIDRSKEDILYEIMLKYGIFDQPTSEVDINGKTMYRVGERHMIVCLEDSIDDKDVAEIAKLEPRVVVFKEDGFKDDNAKINAEYNLKKSGVEDVKAI